jgi:hypothetical protein
MIAFYGF